jgi:hypothetical protein
MLFQLATAVANLLWQICVCASWRAHAELLLLAAIDTDTVKKRMCRRTEPLSERTQYTYHTVQVQHC